MQLNTLDLIVADVPAATQFFRDAVGFAVRVGEERYAELDAGPVTIMLSADALVPVEPARGVILHLRVDDVDAAFERARQHGVVALREREETPWGWESAMIQGPEGVIVDFYRPIDADKPQP